MKLDLNISGFYETHVLSLLLGSSGCSLYYSSVTGKVNSGEQLVYLLTKFYSMSSFCVLNATLICCPGETERGSLMATADTGYMI